MFSEKTRKWCQLPYPDHPQGCPNYGKKALCPPVAPYMKERLKRYSFFELNWVEFDWQGYKQWRKSQHPEWTERQASCCLYFQGSLKSMLLKQIEKKRGVFVLGCGSGFAGTQSMESAGIYVFQTLWNNGIEIEVKPKTKIILVCLCCANPQIKTGLAKFF